MKFSISVIGAGLSGLACARLLQQNGHKVALFDKGRSLGGRCATRQSAYGPINHGLQFLDGADPRLQRLIESLQLTPLQTRLGANQPVDGPGPFYIPTEGANAFAAALAEGLTVSTQVTITELKRTGAAWQLFAGDKCIAESDIAVLAIPPEQADAFGVTPADLPLKDAAYQIQVAALVGSDAPLDLPSTGPIGAIDGLGWITTSADKKRAVVFADNRKSEALIETDKQEIADWIWQTLTQGQSKPEYLSGHRWRFSRVTCALGTGAYYHPGEHLGFCGDWFVGPNAGDAIESGRALAEKIIKSES
ncbi:MAG: FAD-dependent oxidoreductase [Pseudomonadota bacterium]